MTLHYHERKPEFAGDPAARAWPDVLHDHGPRGALPHSHAAAVDDYPADAFGADRYGPSRPLSARQEHEASVDMLFETVARTSWALRDFVARIDPDRSS